jgi:hypothetical protein
MAEPVTAWLLAPARIDRCVGELSMIHFAQDAIENVLRQDNLIPILAIGCGTLVALTAIVFTSLRGIAVARSREQTKRELAAYVAEGSLDPDKAVAIVNAGGSAEDSEA